MSCLARFSIRAGTALLLLVPLLPAVAQAPELPAFRRVLITPERVSAELEKARQGVMVRMPRADFEARVKQAAPATTRREAAHLVKARYWATLEGGALVGGGDWTVLNPAAGPAVLPLPDLKLPLSNVKADGGDAVLGDLEGKGPALEVDKPGQRSVFFDWSLRGSAGVGDLHFDLAVPPCVAATLELTLPPEYAVAVGRGAALLSGPGDAGKPDQRLWRLDFAGRPQVHLVLRRTAGPGAPAPLVLAQTKTHQKLLPDRVAADYHLNLEVLHNAVQELVFDCDPLLHPTEVAFATLALKEWEVKQPPPGKAEKGKAAPPAAGATLIVRLREPVQGPLPELRIVCQAALPPGKVWASPALRPRQALPRGETLELTVHPEVSLEDWKDGDFRLVKTATAGDGSQVLTLTDEGAGQAARPSATLRSGGVDLAVRQAAWWQVRPRDLTYITELTYEVSRGSLFQLGVKLPPAAKDAPWEVEGVEVEPRELLRGWGTVVEKGRRSVVVDLERALTPRARAKVTLQLRSARERPVPSAGLTLPFPAIEPAEAALVSGALAVSVDPFFHVGAAQASVPGTAPVPGGPWGKADPQFYYPYRGQPLTGQLRLVPHRHVVHARCVNEVHVAGDRAALTARITLEPVVGSPDAVELLSSAPVSVWKVEARPGLVRGLARSPLDEALPALLAAGARSPLTAAGTLQARPRAERWRLTLARPLSRAETVTLEVVPPQGALREGRAWEVPLVTVPGAARVEGEVALHLAGAELLEAWSDNLHEVGRDPAGKAAAGPDLWRAFRFGHSAMPTAVPRLRVRARPLADAAAPTQEVCDFTDLVTRLGPEGRLLHRFTFQVRNWRKRTLPLHLPQGARVLSARVEGRRAEPVPAGESAAGVLIELPAPGAGPVRFEVVYATAPAWPSWWPWAGLEAPVPQLPVAPVEARRTWQFPPGVLPLLSGTMQRLPDASRRPDLGPWWAAARAGWQAGGDALAAAGPPFSREEWVARQAQAVAEAEAGLRKAAQAAKALPLGEALRRLAADHLKDGTPLVVDADALRAAGLAQATACPFAVKRPAEGEAPPFWEAVGLVHVPCRGGALLTTRREARLWLDETGKLRRKDDPVDEAVRLAAVRGHDPSGRFRAAAVWAAEPAPPGPAAGGDGFPAELEPGWTEWAPLDGAGGGDEVTVIREETVRVLGVALAVLSLLLAWRVSAAASGRWRFRLLLAWLGGSALALVWLPGSLRGAAWWPALAAAAVALVWYTRRPGSLRRREEPSTVHRVATPAAPVLLALLAALAQVSTAGGPEPTYQVFILPAPAGEPDQETALVPDELLRKLEALARRDTLGEGVLLTARYEGAGSGQVADFKADFQVWCPADRVTVKLPLGADLREGTLLEGAFVHPTALPGDQAGYAVQVNGRKGQVVRLTVPFRVRVGAGGEQHDLVFRVPRLAQSQLALLLPGKAQGPQAVTALGAQSAQAEGGGLRLRAQLGPADLGRRDSAVHVRWRLPGGQAPAPSVRVSEYYLWDLRPPAPGLTAVFKYAVSSGSVGEFVIELPYGLEVRSVEATAGQAAGMPGAPARLHSWDVEHKGGRRLVLRLSEPVSGTVQVTLGLLPRTPLRPGTLALALPTPSRPAALKEKLPTGLLAYRVEGLEATDRPVRLGVVPIPFEQFTQEWLALGMRAAGRDGEGRRAYSFQRSGGPAGLEVTLAAPRPQAAQAVHWHVYPKHADLHVSAKLTAADLTLVEWEVPPPVTVALVSGPDVARYGWSGSRLQVWLREPRRETTVQVEGWARPRPGGDERFVLPCLRMLAPAASRVDVRVTAVPGLTLKEETLTNLTPAPGALLTYRLQDPKQSLYGGVFRVRPEAPEPEAASLTLLEARGGLAYFTSHLHLELPADGAGAVQVRLRGWSGGDVRLEAPGAGPAQELKAAQGERAWSLALPPGGGRQYGVKLVGQAPLPAGGKLSAPEVSVQGARDRGRWLALLGPDLHAEQTRGLAPLKDPAAELPLWPAEAELVRRDRAAWKVTAADWQLRVAVRTGAAAVTVLLAEQEAAVADGRHWLHQGTWMLDADGAGDLHVRLPEGANVVGAALDGSPLTPRQVGPQHVWLSLPSGPHTLRLRWAYGPGEALERPSLAAPQLKGTAPAPAAWAVHVPPGFRPARQRGDAANATAADVAALRAAAYLRLAELLAARRDGRDSAGDDAAMLEAQRHFFDHLRRAESLLVTGIVPAAAHAPDGKGWGVWLADLDRRNLALARQHGFAALRQAAVKQPAAPTAWPGFEDLGSRGTPHYWQAPGTDLPPQAVLQPPAEGRTQEAVLATELVLVALMGAWILSHLPRFSWWARRLWPEQVLALGLLGWQAFGPSLVGVFLICFAAAGRLLLLAVWLHRLVRRWAPDPAAGSTYTPSA